MALSLPSAPPPDPRRAALKAIKQELAQRHTYDFTRYTFGKRWRENWHHPVIGEAIDRWIEGDILRLMIEMPPRSSKSEFTSRRTPARIMGRYPDSHIIHACHTQHLAEKMSRDVQRIMDSRKYAELYPDVFLPGSPFAKPVPGKWTRTNALWELPGHRGIYRAAGAGVAVAGEGADFVILDDPIRGREQAYSATQREKIWEWYWNDIYTRLEGDNSRILLTMTRWHHDDLAGRLLREMDQGGERWHVLTLRAEREEGDDHPDDPREVGDLLWPEKFGPERAEIAKRHPELWAALFQQRPIPEGGNIFKRDWLSHRWDEVPEKCDWLISWDTTFKGAEGSDWVVGTAWWKKGSLFGLFSLFRARLDFPGAIRATREFHNRHPWIRRGLVEDSANGPAIVSSLRGDVPGIRLVSTGGQSKVERARNVLGLFEAGQVLMPPERSAPWLPEYISELMSFPAGAHDDQVDSTTQALNYWNKGRASMWD